MYSVLNNKIFEENVKLNRILKVHVFYHREFTTHKFNIRKAY